MRHLRVLSFILILILLASAANAARISSANSKASPEYASGEVIVKFKPTASITSASVNALLQKYKVKKTEKIFKAKKDKIRAQRAPEDAVLPDLSNVFKLKVPDNADILAIVKELRVSPNVEFAEPNYIYQICAVPNDPYYSSSGSWGQAYDDLWGLKSISAEMAWDISTGSSDIVVAVVDTGVDYEHADLSTNIWSNPAETAGNGIDDDGNGYVDDVKGWDFHNSDDDPMDDNGHGTHCSGTIAGLGNNNIGVVGVVWTGKIMPLKALSAYGGGYTSSLAAALEYAAYNGADVISNSWGGYGTSQLITDAVNYAHSLGCVVIAAAGNDDNDVANYTPAGLDNVIAVASIDHDDQKSDFSNWGTKIEVAAPGGDSSDGDPQQKFVNILSLRANGTDLYGDSGLHVVGTNYYRVRGTSMACPHVAGLAALILSNQPGFTNEQVRQVLWESADDLGDPGWDIYYGYGKINAYRALQIDNVLTAPRFYDTPNDFDGDYVLNWSEAIDGNGIAGYELQEAIPSSLFSDDAEAGDAKWDLSGFSISTNESLSPSHSFYSGADDYLDNSMTVKNPISVPAGGGNLSFWCYYEIETYYDNAYLQISRDGFSWETMATFTGSQKTWQKKSYDLGQYAGESIYIRFRYQTDFIYYYEGFYADDIRVDTVSFSTLSSNVAGTQYEISGRSLGDYYYRVRAKSNQGEWSSWSDTEIVSVIQDIFPPDSPVMNSLLDDHDGNYTLSWSTPADETGIAGYELQESSSEFHDDFENGESKWSSYGFSLTDKKYHSANHCYHSGSGNNLVNHLTSFSPIYVSGSKLSFWCSYAMEKDREFAYLQVSSNNLAWDTLATYTGIQPRWEREEIDLSQYVGESIYVRFKYVTDDANIYSGFYVDDIQAEGGWLSLANNITGTSYAFSGKLNGTYSYKVRAKDTAGNWGPYSDTVLVLVSGTTFASLSNVLVYPNPCQIGGSNRVTFKFLPGDQTIRIYTLAGELVRSEAFQGVNEWEWNLRNQGGNLCARGIYIYMITTVDGQKQIGKIALLN